MSNRGVIFDMDGVLVDSYDAHLRSWQQMAANHGLEMTEQQFAGTFGRTSRDIMRRLWGDEVPEGDFAALDEEKENIYREMLRHELPEMRGAAALIRRLHDAGFTLAIGSSGPPENVKLVRQRLSGGNLIAATVDGMEVEQGKPAPDVFLIAARKLNLPPTRCAVIEDALMGLEAAKRANMAAIGITGTAERAQLTTKADIVVDSLDEIDVETITALIDRQPA